MNATARKIELSQDAAPAVVTFQRRALIKGLETVLPASEGKKSSIPILGGVAFDVSSEGARLIATNLDIRATVMVPAECDGSIQFVLFNPTGVLRLLKLLGDDAITLSVATIQQPPIKGKDIEPKIVVTLTSGSTVADQQGWQWGDFPAWSYRPSKTIKLHFGGEQLLAAINAVEFAISTEETRYYLNGIYLHARPTGAGGALEPCMVATDGHRLSRARIDLDLEKDWRDEDDGKSFGVIIPRLALPMLKTLARRGAVDLDINDTQIEVRQGGVTLNAKLIDGTYPDYERVIPSGNDGSAVYASGIVRGAVIRTNALRPAMFNPLTLTFSATGLNIQMRKEDACRVEENIDLPEKVNKPIKIGANAYYLADILKAFGGPVRQTWSDAASPMVFTAADAPSLNDASHLCVLMPMRV